MFNFGYPNFAYNVAFIRKNKQKYMYCSVLILVDSFVC